MDVELKVMIFCMVVICLCAMVAYVFEDTRSMMLKVSTVRVFLFAAGVWIGALLVWVWRL